MSQSPETPPPSSPPVGEVIAIGDELTTGQRLDTNTQWLAQRLTEAGVDVRYHTTVADDLEANIRVFRTAAERADLVVSTGGLGPTADDLTRDAMAAAAGVGLIDVPELARCIEERFTSRGREMPPQNLRQAQLPEGAAAIPNPGGTAPGVDQTVGRCRLFALPGVPAEMREMWTATVAPAIESLPGERRVVRHGLVKCFGIGESHAESLVPELIARGREPLVGITASLATITFRVSASGPDVAAAFAAMEPTLAEIREKLADYIFAEQPGGEPEIGLERVVVDLLAERGERLATGEGMTRGLLASWLAEADRENQAIASSRCANDPTPPDEQALRLLGDAGADYGLAVAGSEREGKVTIALAVPDDSGHGRVVSKEITLIGHPSIHAPLVAKHALNLLRRSLLGIE
ncbi:Putative competence-damage inducible protein [Planctomycetes bacterium MalM25]|nr:Putative competence-damage inducible protein [Planctomycetes bacterium MalM25]